MAAGFTTAWARPTLPPAQWVTGVAKFTTPAFAKALKTTDPSRVPATKRTGPAKAIMLSPTTTSPTRVVCAVPTDSAPVYVTVDLVDGRWLVSNISPTAPETD